MVVSHPSSFEEDRFSLNGSCFPFSSGLAWLSNYIILSWGYQTPGDGRTAVRNEIFMTHIQSGYCRALSVRKNPSDVFSGRQEPFRSEVNHDESPIESFKVSHTKFVLIFVRSQMHRSALCFSKKLFNYSLPRSTI